MSQTGRQTINTSNVLSVIMGGGQGTRLFPLTKRRAKPAVPWRENTASWISPFPTASIPGCGGFIC